MDSYSLDQCMGRFLPQLMVKELWESDPEIIAFAESLLSLETVKDRVTTFSQIREIKGDEFAVHVLHEFTKDIHETKHYLDFVGTTFGRTFLISTLRRTHEFFKKISQVEGSTIRLPLFEWARQNDCPVEIKLLSNNWAGDDYANKYFFGDFQVDCPTTEDVSEPLMIYNYPLGEKELSLPCVPLKGIYTGIDTFYVLGAVTFLEASAFSLQVAMVDRFFGENSAMWFYKQSIAMLSDVESCRYVLLGIIHNRLGRHILAPLLDFAIADYCLMGNPNKVKSHFHPGIRYLSRYSKVKQIPWHLLAKQDLMSVHRYISEEVVDTPEVLSTAKEYLSSTKKTLAFCDANQLLSGNPFYQYQYMLEKRMKKLLETRLQKPDVFIDPGVYLNSILDFPFDAPISINRPTIWTRDDPPIILDSTETNALSKWPLIIKLASNIYSESQLECPFIGLNLKCELKSDGCQARHAFTTADRTCTFGNVLHSLGISEKKFSTV